MSDFLKGMDISSLFERIDHNMQVFDENGKPCDVFELLKRHNINSIRLRIWNEPELVPEADGYCNLSDTIQMAKLIKEHDMHFMLDFHYSDHWADPGQQRKPHAWKDLGFEDLKKAVYDYTTMVLRSLEAENCLPDIVQVGNEIRSGMLFPDGEVPNYTQLAALVNAGISAIRDVSSDISVMIHLDQGGRFYYLKEWFDAMFEAGMLPIDCIGISFYSFWHGTFMDLKDSMLQLVERYHLPVCVVETAHPWRTCPEGHISADQMKTAGLPAGIEEQSKSLDLVFHIVDSIPNNMGMGVYYWEPICIPQHDMDSWAQNMGMLNDKGQILSSFNIYRDFERGHKLCDDLDAYMKELYLPDPNLVIPTGVNLIPNGDFANGIEDWWYEKAPDSLEVQCKNQEIYLSAPQNFHYDLFKDIFVEQSGSYQLLVDYRGSNTTGVVVKMYIKRIGCNGEEVIEKEIFPSDVDWVTHTLDDLTLERGTIRVGIVVTAPPVFGRIRNMRLYKK